MALILLAGAICRKFRLGHLQELLAGLPDFERRQLALTLQRASLGRQLDSVKKRGCSGMLWKQIVAHNMFAFIWRFPQSKDISSFPS
jgi:hypothetical protein